MQKCWTRTGSTGEDNSGVDCVLCLHVVWWGPYMVDYDYFSATAPLHCIINHIFGSHPCEDRFLFQFFIETVEEGLSAYYSVI